MPRIQKISSSPLVQCEKTGLWLPDRHRTTSYVDWNFNRRKFIQLAGIGAVGLTSSLAFNALAPKKAEAGWGAFIPVFLATLQAADLIVDWGNRLNLFAFLRNEEPETQEGNIGVQLISSQNNFYNDTEYVDAVPARTENIYRIEELTPGPPGQNRAVVETAYNSKQLYYTCRS